MRHQIACYFFWFLRNIAPWLGIAVYGLILYACIKSKDGAAILLWIAIGYVALVMILTTMMLRTMY